jgi:hypothetical protein
LAQRNLLEENSTEARGPRTRASAPLYDTLQSPPVVEQGRVTILLRPDLPKVGRICKPNCKPTMRHRTVSGITGRHRDGEIGELEHTLSH